MRIAAAPRNETGAIHVLLRMDRIFLAIIVSGLLLAAASTSLLVLSNGGNTTVSVNLPAQTQPERPRH